MPTEIKETRKHLFEKDLIALLKKYELVNDTDSIQYIEIIAKTDSLPIIKVNYCIVDKE